MKHIILPVFIGLFAISTPMTAPHAAPSPKQVPAPATFGAESATLPNGLRVVVIPNHRAPVVTHMIWYKVGAIDEPAGQSGIAHFLEHLMFKGSENVPPGEFSRRVRAMGGNDNAFTSQDYTAYFQTVAADRLEDVMAMEADRMRGLTLPWDEVLSERDVVMEERRQNTDSDPRAQLYEQMRHALFPGHPYGIPVIGWPHELAKLSRDNAAQFHARWYAPNNATVVIAGDVRLDDIMPVLERTYGTIPTCTYPLRNEHPIMSVPGESRITMHSDQIHQPLFQRLIRLPSLRQSKNDYLALQVLESILSDGAASRLYKTLVVDMGIASNAGFSYNGAAWDDATGGLYAVPNDGVQLEKLESALDALLSELAQKGVTEREVIDAKTRMNDRAALARDSLNGPAMTFGTIITSGGTIDDVEQWPAAIDTVTVDDVNRVAQFLVRPSGTHGRGVTGWVLPASSAQSSGTAQ